MVVNLVNKPKFKPNQTVYVINTDRKIYKTKIRLVKCNYISIENEDYFSFTGIYEVNDFLRRANGFGTLEEKYIFASEKQAVKNTLWIEVDFPDNDWMQAIGLRSEEDNKYNIPFLDISDSDLGVCCAVISDIRDILYKIWEEKGILELDRLILQSLVKRHGGFTFDDNQSITPIFKKMEIDYSILE